MAANSDDVPARSSSSAKVWSKVFPSRKEHRDYWYVALVLGVLFVPAFSSAAGRTVPPEFWHAGWFAGLLIGLAVLLAARLGQVVLGIRGAGAVAYLFVVWGLTALPAILI